MAANNPHMLMASLGKQHRMCVENGVKALFKCALKFGDGSDMDIWMKIQFCSSFPVKTTVSPRVLTHLQACGHCGALVLALLRSVRQHSRQTTRICEPEMGKSMGKGRPHFQGESRI